MKKIPLCLPQKTYRTTIIIIMIFLVVTPILFYAIGYVSGYQSVFFRTSSISPSVDGYITESDWKRSNFIVKQYTDTDNVYGDTDGFNYMYVGSDSDNVYVALDLITDNTQNSEEDWIGILFNTDTEEILATEENWGESDTSQGLFFNVKTNETILQSEGEIWNRYGEKTEYSIPFPAPTIKYGSPRSNNLGYPYYDFATNWEKGIEEYDDELGYFIYTQKVLYNQSQGINLAFRLGERILGAIFEDLFGKYGYEYIEKPGTVSYFEFDIGINIYSLFPDVPIEYLDSVLEDMEIDIEAALIPFWYWIDNPLPDTWDAPLPIDDMYDMIGTHCYAMLQNPVYDIINQYESTPDNTVYIEQDVYGDEINFQILTSSDYFLGHDDLLEDGILKKSLTDEPLTTLGGLVGNYYQVNLVDTIKRNNGWIRFNVFGLSALEDLFSDQQWDYGFAFDYFNLIVKTSDSIHTSPYAYTTIENAIIKSSFGASFNSDIPHKMVEITIPKTEFLNFNEEEISIMTIGYSGDKIPSDSLYGYDGTNIASQLSFWFGSINVDVASVFYDSQNYYVIPLKRDEQRFEVI